MAAEGAKAGIEELKRVLHTEHGWHVAGILPFLGKEGYEVLISGLESPYPAVRSWSASNYGWPLSNYFKENRPETFVVEFQANASEGIPKMTELMRDSNERVSSAAMMGLLGFSNKPEVLQAYENILRDENLDSALRGSAARNFGRTVYFYGTSHDSNWKHIVEVLEQFKNNENEVVAERVQFTLEWMENLAEERQQESASENQK